MVPATRGPPAAGASGAGGGGAWLVRGGSLGERGFRGTRAVYAGTRATEQFARASACTKGDYEGPYSELRLDLFGYRRREHVGQRSVNHRPVPAGRTVPHFLHLLVACACRPWSSATHRCLSGGRSAPLWLLGQL